MKPCTLQITHGVGSHNLYSVCLSGPIVMFKGHFTHETDSLWPLHFKHSHWWKRWGRSKFASSHYAWGTNGGSMWMQDGCKVDMDSYKASNGSCFMVTGTFFKTHRLEVDLTWNRETVALQLLVYSILSSVRTWIKKFIEIAFHWACSHVWLHTTLEGLWPHCMILEVSWDGLWTPSFGITVTWSQLLARVWSGPKFVSVTYLFG